MARGRPRTKKDGILLKSAELFGWALGGLEREISQTKERLAALTAQASQLRGRIGGKKTTVSISTAEPKPRPVRRRQMSPAARKRISEMMKKRWAETKKAGKSRL